ncbi:B12-binding domain-containing radical SAM protein [Desulfosarcina widdelii]|uniref:B12-binding domain-containing radical SAM protein n=1 Tax=Desulfosarcina widdelii TaxID=947919 RepID=A0A5K7Z6N3_9BACT|nr:B12-binding domain-containing radical SAM protein [Desulfosarcina widdelii]BBO75341.1 B12-binding domain-containing radical SAM protein [Desulfosarcina widdelii]
MPWLKNILLVYPEIPKNTYWSFEYSLRFINRSAALPPLGLITIAALLPKRFDLKLVDMNIEPLKQSDLEWADAVFVSAMIIQKDSLADIIRMCRKAGTPVVAGGPYPTASHEEIQGVDHFVLGEAEAVLPDFLADLENGIAGRVYRAKQKPDITHTVVPRFDLLKMNRYGSMAIQYSRGCPFNCEFCDIWIMYGNKPRLKSAESMVREIDALYRLGWRGSIFIVDDNFIGNKTRVKRELLPAIGQWEDENRFVFDFYTEASINMADDPELMDGMNAVGFGQVFVGIETPSKKSLSETGKRQNLKCDLLEAVRTIQQHGIEVTAGFILGFDSDTEDIFDRQIDFIQAAGIPKAMVGVLTALPGTKLYRRLEKDGRIVEGNLTGSNTHTMCTNVATTLPPDILKQGYKKVLGTLYDANLKNYFARCETLLARLQGTSYPRRPLRLYEIRALLKSIAIQPFTQYGWQYLKFVGRNLIRRPSLFAEAITHAVMGHHFYVITQETLKVDAVSSTLDDIYEKTRAYIGRQADLVKATSVLPRRKLYEGWAGCMAQFKRAKNVIDHVHKDFRADVVRHYYEMVSRTRSLFEDAERQLHVTD